LNGCRSEANCTRAEHTPDYIERIVVPKEKESFGSTIFDYQQNPYHLSVSFSIYRDDFYMDLKDRELSESLLELRLERVKEIRVRRDNPTSVLVLAVTARCNADGEEKIT
jgi:hypothetical protein